MDQISVGMGVRDTILAFASLITVEHWPGLISLLLFVIFFILATLMGRITIRRIFLLNRLKAKVVETENGASFQRGLDAIESDLNSQNNSDARRLAGAFAEFRETLLEPARHGETNVRNAFRPGNFINLEDLHFGLGSWRVWPGLFVSVGLLLTFLGLIAALAATKQSIEAGGWRSVQDDRCVRGPARQPLTSLGKPKA